MSNTKDAGHGTKPADDDLTLDGDTATGKGKSGDKPKHDPWLKVPPADE